MDTRVGTTSGPRTHSVFLFVMPQRRKDSICTAQVRFWSTTTYHGPRTESSNGLVDSTGTAWAPRLPRSCYFAAETHSRQVVLTIWIEGTAFFHDRLLPSNT